eukprot:979673-Amphidinium_carterae.1
MEPQSESANRLSAKPVPHSISATLRQRQRIKQVITCWTCGRTGHTSNQCKWKGPVYQLDATDSEQPPMPLESGTLMTSQQPANQQSQSSDPISGLWSQGPTITEIIGAIMDIHNKVKEDNCCRIISQSDVSKCGQKGSLMYDSGAAVSIAPLSFAPHVPLQPMRGDQKLQSVTDAEIKIHGFKGCTIMPGGIGLRVNFIICDASCPIIGNSTRNENQCYAIVKPPPHKSWIMSLRSSHGWIHQQGADQCICGSDQTTHEEESDQHHGEDVAKSFNQTS